MKLGVFVPGRLQSQRLPQKLIKPIGNSCLWEICLDKLNFLPSKYEKVALCNDPELVDIAKKFKTVKTILRDDSTKVDGDLRFIFKDIEQMEATHVMFLNPCLPMLGVGTIQFALDYFERNNLDYMESVKPFTNWVFNNYKQNVNKMDFKRLSTKELEEWYLDANAFRIFNKRQFFKDGMMLKEGFEIYPISDIEALDVDTREEFYVVKAVYEEVHGRYHV
jgi:CMP-N-acetylneuraminic acid synthetase